VNVAWQARVPTDELALPGFKQAPVACIALVPAGSDFVARFHVRAPACIAVGITAAIPNARIVVRQREGGLRASVSSTSGKRRHHEQDRQEPPTRNDVEAIVRTPVTDIPARSELLSKRANPHCRRLGPMVGDVNCRVIRFSASLCSPLSSS
jgi:hypothetical protein